MMSSLISSRNHEGGGPPVGGQLSIELTNPVIVLKLVCEAEAG